MEEIWKECHLSNQYSISNLGRVKNNETNRILKIHIDNRGYKRVHLRIKPKRKICQLHRLLMFGFKCNEYFDGAIVNHIDGNKLNNSLDNLEWCTNKENSNHALKLGLYVFKYGETNTSAKLRESDISKIKKLYEEVKNYSEIGRLYNVSDVTIRKIIKGKTWTHVE